MKVMLKCVKDGWSACRTDREYVVKMLLHERDGEKEDAVEILADDGKLVLVPLSECVVTDDYKGEKFREFTAYDDEGEDPPEPLYKRVFKGKKGK